MELGWEASEQRKLRVSDSPQGLQQSIYQRDWEKVSFHNRKIPRIFDHTTPGQRASELKGETEEAPRNAPLPASAKHLRLSVSRTQALHVLGLKSLALAALYPLVAFPIHRKWMCPPDHWNTGWE